MPPTRKSTFATGTAQLEKPSLVANARNTSFAGAGTSIESCRERSPSGSANDVFVTSLKSRQEGAANVAAEQTVASVAAATSVLFPMMLPLLPFFASGPFEPREVILQLGHARIERLERAVRARLHHAAFHDRQHEGGKGVRVD